MDIQTVSVAFSGLKFAKEAVTALLQLKIDADSRERVNEAIIKVGQAQDTLFELREQLFNYQTQVQDLKQQINALESWELKFSQYKLVSTNGGGTVYEFIGNPKHYICPSCINKKEIHILQYDNNWAGTYTCTGCSSAFLVRGTPNH